MQPTFSRYAVGNVVTNTILIRVGLDCGGEVHWSVERQGYFEAVVGTADKMEKIILKEMSQVGVLFKSSFLCEGLRLPKKLGLWRIPLAKSVTMLPNNVRQPCHFSSVLGVLHRRSLHSGVNPSLKNPFRPIMLLQCTS